MRNPENYDGHCALLDGPLGADDSTTYGVTGSSPLNEIDYFHVANWQLPQDVMHVLFEGVLPLETKLMLGSFLEDGYLTLEQLNARISNFTYGRIEARNKPPKPFQATYFTGTGSKLHLSGKYFTYWCSMGYEYVLPCSCVCT